MRKLHRPRVSENQGRKKLKKAEDGHDKMYGNPRGGKELLTRTERLVAIAEKLHWQRAATVKRLLKSALL